MSTENHLKGSAFFPQYFIIGKTDPQYVPIKKQLLDSRPHPIGSSCYFIRAGADSTCICRIKAGNETVLFYEIMNHTLAGISEQEIQEVVLQPSCAAPLPGYFFLTPEIEQKIRTVYSLGSRSSEAS